MREKILKEKEVIIIHYKDLKSLLDEEFVQRDSFPILEETRKSIEELKDLNYDLMILILMLFTSLCFDFTRNFFLGLALLIYGIKILIFCYEKSRSQKATE